MKEITEENYKEEVLKRSVICCWIILLVCFIIKLCGGNFFEIACKNRHFVKFCDFVDHSSIKYILQYEMFMASSYLLVAIAQPRFKLITLNGVYVTVYLSCVWTLKLLVSVNVFPIPIYVTDIIDFALLFLVLLEESRNWLRSIFAVLVLFVFTLLTTLTKNIGIADVITNSFLVNSIFMIDYYIMLILTALYCKMLNRR